MKRARVAVLSVSLVVVLTFSGLLMASRGTEEELFRSLGTLSEVVHLVLTQYVDELNQEALSLSLDSGFVEALDPAAAVLPGEVVEAYQKVVSGQPPYGLVLGLRLGSAAVRHAVPGSPAATAGLQEWEVIERVEGVYTRGRPLWQVRLDLAQRLGRGEVVHLTVVDRLVDEKREVALEATAWQPTVASAEQREGVPVVHVASLPAGAAGFVRGLLPADGPLVLDLRDLVWGDEEEAVRTVDLFVAAGTLGAWRGRRAGEQVFAADPAAVSPRPLVVLLSAGTEGVGEILAAGLERAGAVLVGHTTAGHAAHMHLVQDGDLSLWLPVAYWLRADGTPIHKSGVEPGEKVETEGAAEGADPVLERGLELARGQLAKAA
jgi:C-terminal processing protease CtpA/Prc